MLMFYPMLVPFWFNFGIENRARSLLGDVFGSVFGASWGFLGSSRCVFGRVGASWRCLGASGLHPGASWGAIIAPGRVCGAFKTLQKSGVHLEYAAVSPREGGTPSDRVHVGIILAPFLCPWVRSILEGFGATFQHIFVNSGGLS